MGAYSTMNSEICLKVVVIYSVNHNSRTLNIMRITETSCKSLIAGLFPSTFSIHKDKGTNMNTLQINEVKAKSS